ncbi:MAG: dihydropteroate synthase [Rhodospirillaceae bacterium]|nr:dihydropteroate synthase [Rhodospirillaceae bacterium]
MVGRVHLRPTTDLPMTRDLYLAPVPDSAGAPGSFHRVHVLARLDGAVTRLTLPADIVVEWADDQGLAGTADLLAAIVRPRGPFAGLALDRPRLMGVVNVTPDSFSDGGDLASPAAAIAHGLALRDAGADILDVGGESTRPGANPVSIDEELARVLPVVSGLAAAGACVSIDTRNAAVMQAALEAGARIVNDITALTGDPQALAVVAARRCPVVLMHMLGEPRTMQADPRYGHVTCDVFDHLEGQVAACRAAGLAVDDIAIDPGIGFGKTVAHNTTLLRDAGFFLGLGGPVLYGVSRKTFIGKLSRGEAPKERVAGSIAAGLAAVARGAHILRVHDVAETAQALAVWSAIGASEPDAAS